MGLPWRGARAAVAPGSPWGDLSLCPPSSWLTPPRDACSCAPSVSLEGASSLTLTGCPCLDWTLLLPGGPAPTPSTLTPAPLLQVACEYGMVRVVSETGDPRGKDYCILYNPQWAHLPHDLSKAVSAARPATPLPRAVSAESRRGAEARPQLGHWRGIESPLGLSMPAFPRVHGTSLSPCHEQRMCCHRGPGLGGYTAAVQGHPSSWESLPGLAPPGGGGSQGPSLLLPPLVSVPCGHSGSGGAGRVPEGCVSTGARPLLPALHPSSSRVGVGPRAVGAPVTWAPRAPRTLPRGLSSPM